MKWHKCQKFLDYRFHIALSSLYSINVKDQKNQNKVPFHYRLFQLIVCLLLFQFIITENQMSPPEKKVHPGAGIPPDTVTPELDNLY